MLDGLARACRETLSRFWSPASKPIPRVSPYLYGGRILRGASSDCYRRIRRARLSNQLTFSLLPPQCRLWFRPRRWPLTRSLQREFTRLTCPRTWIVVQRRVQVFRKTLPSAPWIQWYWSAGIPALLLLAGESSHLFTIDWDSSPPSSLVASDSSRAVELPELSFIPVQVSEAPLLRPKREPEEQPPIDDAAIQPFAAIATSHIHRSVQAHQSLKIHKSIQTLQNMRVQAIREHHEYLEKKEKQREAFAKNSIVAQALQVAKLDYQGGDKATISLEIYDSFASLQKGVPDAPDEAQVFNICTAGKRSETIDRYSDFVSTGGPIEITNYGYSSDYTPDTNSNYHATGLGGTRPLIPGISAALSKSLVNKLNAKPGAVIEFIDGKGRTFLVTHDDRSPQRNYNIDVYRPTFGSNYFRAHVKAARVVRQGDSSISHSKGGLPFSLQNYRDAVLQMAAERKALVAEDSSSETTFDPPEDFFAPELERPRQADATISVAQELDQVADTPFRPEDFPTTQELVQYLQSGTESFQKGVQFVRNHGATPTDFPPLLRIQSNLRQAQEAREALAARQVELWNEHQDLGGKLLHLEMEVALAEDSLQRQDLLAQISDYHCMRDEILTQLAEHQGTERSTLDRLRSSLVDASSAPPRKTKAARPSRGSDS